jgi:hypothetical protein
MMAAQPYELGVDPSTMLRVTLTYPTGPRVVIAISCRYVPVSVQAGQQVHKVVAVEVLHDPTNPTPGGPYFANPALLEKIVLPANALTDLRPYV